MEEHVAPHGTAVRNVAEVVERLTADNIDVVRVVYSDLIGTERARDVLVEHLPTAMTHGLTFCRAVYHVSPQGDTVPVTGGLDAGLPDILIRPDLSTLAALPWEPGVASCLGDAIDPATGAACEEEPRGVLRRVVNQLAEFGLRSQVGPELEYFLCEPDPSSPTGWRRYGDATGNVYVAGRKGDPDGHLVRFLRRLRDFGLNVTAANHEYCSGQFEINLMYAGAVAAADSAFRFKAAVKELARLDGKLATFMAKPFNDEGGSGFHTHLSCVDNTGRNVFYDPQGQNGLSDGFRYAVAGVLAHAPALSALLNPTINSYKRLGKDTIAPWLVDWGLDNRSVMVRIPPERGDATRMEIRLGDGAANPYLGIAGAIAAVFLGLRDRPALPAPLEGYGYDPAKAPELPSNLGSALDALETDHEFTAVLGKTFVSAFCEYKRNELERFGRHVTDWEFTEYAYHL